MHQFQWNKYGNKKVEVDGIIFDSKKEASRYKVLKLRKLVGEISNLQLQKKFILQEKFRKDGKAIREISYIADFYYYDKDKNKYIVEDTKGFRTKDYMLKKKMFEFKYPDLTITEL